MRITLITILLCFVSIIAKGQIYVGQQQGLPYRDTSKQIKIIHSTLYSANIVDGKPVKGDRTNEYLFYYDKHGSLVKRIIIWPLQNGKYKAPNNKPDLVSPNVFNDSVIVLNKVVYDDKGNLITLPHDPAAYNLGASFKYNKQNQLIQLNQFSNDVADGNRFNNTQTVNYGANGKIEGYQVFNVQSKLIDKTSYTYDKANRLIEVQKADSTHIYERTKLIYNTLNGKLMHLVIISDERLPVQYDYEYDNRDRKSKIYLLYGANKRLYGQYKYDANDKGYQYTEDVGSGTRVVQTIKKGYKSREVFTNNHPNTLQQWHYDKHDNAVYTFTTNYAQPPNKVEPINATIMNDVIQYRGGIFSAIGQWFRKKPLAVR
jgi:hypothetical protein